MNRQKWIAVAAALGMIGGASAALCYLQGHQTLGQPGIRTVAIADSPRREILLPAQVLDYQARVIEPEENVLKYMPADTSFAQRLYQATRGDQTNQLAMNVVLMGADRSSIHKAKFCLTGSGWTIDEANSMETTIPIHSPRPYDLPVMKLPVSRPVMINGRPMLLHGFYVYWFVADHQLTARHGARMWLMARDLLLKGVLQRWAYVSCLVVCQPGQENAAYARIQEFIQASVPQFQIAASPPGAGVVKTALK